MAIAIETASSIFPGTRGADVVPNAIEAFNQLSAEEQLALIWFDRDLQSRIREDERLPT